MIWSILAGYVFGGVLIWLGFAGNIGAMKTSSKQLFGSVGIFVVVVAMGLTLDALFGWWNRMPKVFIGAAGILIIVERSLRMLSARRMGGKVLLDIGRVRMPDMIINAFVGLALAWFAWLDISAVMESPHWVLQDVSLPFFGLAIAYAVLVQGLVRRKLLEHGIFLGTGFLPWGTIRSFEWEKDSTLSSTLVLQRQSKFPLSRITTFSVSAALIPSVEEVLRSRGIDSAEGTTTGGSDPLSG